MPAAAVIPAPIAYIKVVAVKKLVVKAWVLTAGLAQASSGVWVWCHATGNGVWCWPVDAFSLGRSGALQEVSLGTRMITLRKIECSKQASYA